MTETRHAQSLPSGHTRSAVGRLALLVEVGDGTEKVTFERRWPDAESARLWCEAKLHGAPASTAVLEIQVTEEVWGRRHAWEATASRHLPQTLQLGVRSPAGVVTWGSTLDVSTDLGARRRR
jgi:hypothetical protein